MVMVTISELLTISEIGLLLRLYNSHRTDGQFVELCKQHIIEPNLSRINKATGQENDSEFLALLLEHTLSAIDKRMNTAA